MTTLREAFTQLVLVSQMGRLEISGGNGGVMPLLPLADLPRFRNGHRTRNGAVAVAANDHKMKLLLLIAAVLIAAATLQAQQTTNSGIGVAGNGVTGTSPRYDIGITADGAFITINGSAHIVLPYSGTTPYARIKKWDAVKNKYVPYGIIRRKTLDGTQFMGGTIFIRTLPTMRVVNFKAIAFYTPAIMPAFQTSNLINVYVYSPFTGTFVPRVDLTVATPPFIDGAIWLNSNYTLHSAVFNGHPTAGGELIAVPVPAPSGPSNVPQLLPSKMF